MVVIEDGVSPSENLLAAEEGEGGMQGGAAAQQAGGRSAAVGEVSFSAASNQTDDSWQNRRVGTRDIAVLTDVVPM